MSLARAMHNRDRVHLSPPQAHTEPGGPCCRHSPVSDHYPEHLDGHRRTSPWRPAPLVALSVPDSVRPSFARSAVAWVPRGLDSFNWYVQLAVCAVFSVPISLFVAVTSTIPSNHPMMNAAPRPHPHPIYQQPQNHRPAGPDTIPHPQAAAMYNNGAPGQSHPHGPSLPPFSSIESMGPPRSQPVSSMRYNAADNGGRGRPHDPATGSKRAAPSSTVTSADSSDAEEEGGELPASGLVAPWEVLRGLADVAIERAAKVRDPERSHDTVR